MALKAQRDLGQARDRELTCTVTPSAPRAAQAPRRHSADSRKVFMAAVPKRQEWLVWMPGRNSGTFKDSTVTE